jgi:hypothetical protein
MTLRMPGGRQHRGRAIVAVALAGLLLAGCGGGGEPQVAPATVEPATPSPTASPEPEPTPDDPYAVPEVIDEEYLNRVFEALEAIAGDATRIIVAEKMYPPEADDLHLAIYTGPALQAVRDEWLDILIVDPQLEGYRDPPGDLFVTTKQVLEITERCIFVEVTRDYTGVIAADPPPETIYLALKRTEDPEPPNPTPWVVNRQARLAEGVEQPEASLCDA